MNLSRDTFWPLCGRITAAPPASFVIGARCPAARRGDPTFTDEPVTSTFGPRTLSLANGSAKYQWHRGIDMSAPVGTPVFAIADGIVVFAGWRRDFAQPVIILRHPKDNTSKGYTCGAHGCYHSLYLHLRTHTQGGCCATGVTAGAQVVGGQHIGYSGRAGNGAAQLHFEVRDGGDAPDTSLHG